MLAVMKALSGNVEYRFSAIAHGNGALAQELRQLDIPVCALATRDAAGQRFPSSVLHQNLADHIQAVQPEILHSNSLSMSRLVGQLPASVCEGVRRTGHLRDIIKLNKTVIRDLNANDRLVAVSAATRQFHVNQGLAMDKCCVIHNGVDLQQFCPRTDGDDSAILMPHLPANSKLVLCAGQICLRKGQLVLAQAVCQLLQQRDDIYLLIVGERHSAKAESVEYERAIQHQFIAAGRSDHLIMPGYRSDMHMLMNAADMLVHASHQEPFGRTLLEAAASGLPIVATDVGGTSELLRHGRDAILVEPDCPEQLCAAIVRLADQPEVACTLAESARGRVEELFSSQRAAQELAEFWDRVVSE